MILADENIPKAVVMALRKEGFVVVWISETTYRGKTDEEVIALANELSADIITRDKGFLNEAWKSSAIHTRLVLIRDTIKSEDAEAATKIIMSALEGSSEKYQVIEKGRISAVHPVKIRLPAF